MLLEMLSLLHPNINVLINNAAIDPKVKGSIGPSGDFETLSESDWNLSVDVILKRNFSLFSNVLSTL